MPVGSQNPTKLNTVITNFLIFPIFSPVSITIIGSIYLWSILDNVTVYNSMTCFPVGVDEALRVLNWAERQYPDSALFLYFKSRILRLQVC